MGAALTKPYQFNKPLRRADSTGAVSTTSSSPTPCHGKEDCAGACRWVPFHAPHRAGRGGKPGTPAPDSHAVA